MPKTILLYQIGKVGSVSIQRTLFDCKFVQADSADAIAQASGEAVAHTHSHETAAAIIDHPIHAHGERQLIVITLVRDLLQRAISAFFHNLANIGHPLAVGERDHVEGLSTKELIAAFRERHDLDKLEQWFAEWFSSFGRNLEFDVFAHPFPTVRGFAGYRSRKAKIAVIRMESLNHSEEWLGRYLEVRGFTLWHANQMDNRWQGKAYRDFLARFRPTAAELDAFYGTEIMRHFYSAEEIRAFRARWNSPGKS